MSRGLELNLFTWPENRHCDTQTWRIKEELSKVLIIRVFLSDFSTHYKFHNDAPFGRRMTPGEQLKKNQRALNMAMQELDREQQEKIIADIKKMAKQERMDTVKIMAKVR